MQIRWRFQLNRALKQFVKRGPGLLTIAFLVVALLWVNRSYGQSPEPTDTIRIDTDLVNLNVNVLTKTPAQQIAALQQKEFAIFENGAPQEISFFASAETPFDLVLLLDLSGSTSNKIGLIRKSSKRFVDAARSGDRIAIVTFSSEVKIVSTLNPDHEALTEKIDNNERPGGGTKLWASMGFEVEHILSQSQGDHRGSTVVVKTDRVQIALQNVLQYGTTTSVA